MSNIESTNRANFFPQSKTAQNTKANQNAAVNPSIMKRNDYNRTVELNKLTSDDAKVQINDAIKDYSRIKKAVDGAPDIDNSQKIADLKARIEAGTYSVDYEALADKILESEF
jgi:negative regulator of flagellin synthesis FlgM